MAPTNNYAGFSALLADCKFLTREEEREHFRRWREDGSAESKEILFRSVAPFMLTVVLKFCRRYDKLAELEEYESLACEGVLRSLDLWNADRGCRLATYAAWQMWRYMQTGMASHQLIPVPIPLLAKSNDPRSRKYQQKYARFAAAARRVRGLSMNSGDEPGDAGWARSRDGDPADTLADDEETNAKIAAAKLALKALPERLRHVIVGRIWEGKTLKQVGQELGLTRERVRQLEMKAAKLMRQQMMVA